MAVFKTMTYKKRDQRHVPTGDFEGALQPQRILLMSVRQMAQECTDCFESLKRSQHALMRAVQGYLGFDATGLDESALSLLQASASFFEQCAPALSEHGLPEVVSACDRILRDFDKAANMLKERDAAHTEFEHYNEKVAGILATPEKQLSTRDRDKLTRNQEKLTSAHTAATSKRSACDKIVRTLVDRRRFAVRTTLHAALRSYVGTLARLGRGAGSVAEAYEEELKPGTTVEVIGFPEESDLSRAHSVISGVLDTGEISIAPIGCDGVEKAVRKEHLVPIRQHPDSASEASPSRADAKGDTDSANADLAGGDSPADSAWPSAETAAAAFMAGAGADDSSDEGAAVQGPATRTASGGAPLEGGVERAPSMTGPIQVSPDRGPTEGCEAELVAKIDGVIEDVFVDGEPAEILEAAHGSVRLRLPAGAAPGPARVEVRRAGWQQYVVRADAAFLYYQALTWGACGNNIEIGASLLNPKMRTSSVALRTTGVFQGVCLTSIPVPVLEEDVEDAADQKDVARQRRYFEIEVLEKAEQKTTKTMSIGFAWPPPPGSVPAGAAQRRNTLPARLARDDCGAAQAGGAEGSRAGAVAPEVRWGWLPESAVTMQRGFVLGGDLPKAHFAGNELGKLSGWRPLLDVKAGTVLGALLEETVAELCLTVYQDGVKRCTWTVPRPQAWDDSPPPHGVVDVCGTIKRVEIRQDPSPPPPPAVAMSPSADAAGSSPEAGFSPPGR